VDGQSLLNSGRSAIRTRPRTTTLTSKDAESLISAAPALLADLLTESFVALLIPLKSADPVPLKPTNGMLGMCPPISP
jgi:hypothetical protein